MVRLRLLAGALLGSLGQLSLPSLGVGKSTTSLLAGAHPLVSGDKVTLCDPGWQAMSHSSRTSSCRGL